MYGDPDIARVPDPLLPLVEGALTKDPKSRPTAQQLLDRLTSASSRHGNADDTTQVILARIWQSGAHTNPTPAGLPADAATPHAPGQATSPSPWLAGASAVAEPPTAEPPSAEPIPEPPTEPPTTDAPVPSMLVPTAPPAGATAAGRQPVGRRMATIATSAMAALRLRRPNRGAPDPGQRD
jgi:hypothetical protein